jgi:hypothetical protein
MTAAPANRFGVTRFASWSGDGMAADLRAQLSQEGIPFEEVALPHLVGLAGTVALLGYVSPTSQQAVTVLAIPHRYEIDDYAEDYFYLPGLSIAEAVARGEPWWIELYEAVKRWPEGVARA